MKAQDVFGYLRELVRDLDTGRSPRVSLLRTLVVPVAVPAAIGFAVGCGPMHSPYGTDPPELDEVCDNGIDDDDDSFVDCEDADCASAPECEPISTGVYGVPFEDCCNLEDNDGDGLIGCEDDDCSFLSACQGWLYASPFEGDCSDVQDNDCDGLIDCDDDDCFDECSEDIVALYAEPFEPEADCSDGIDNDENGLTDCDDLYCVGSEDCPFNELMYGAPFPDFTVEVCDDEIDNDGDELIDCDDADCSSAENCQFNGRYAASFPELEQTCDDDFDNDGDELVDCDDPDCDDDEMCLGVDS